MTHKEIHDRLWVVGAQARGAMKRDDIKAWHRALDRQIELFKALEALRQ